MIDNEIRTFLPDIPNIKMSNVFIIKNDFKTIQEKQIQKIFNEQRNLNKLSLRKKKLNDILFFKRNNDTYNINAINSISNDINNNKYINNNFVYFDLYFNLKNSFDSKNEHNILNILNSFSTFIKSNNITEKEFEESLLKFDYNINNNEILLKEKYSLAFLLFNIGIYTKNKYIYIHCFTHLLNFSFISDDFCKEILTISNINLIYAKLIYFYPIFNLNNFDNFNSVQKVESFYMGGQIFRFFGNLYISSSNNEVFKQIDFYKKIIDLIFILNIDEINSKYNIIYFEFLETLIWILTLFSEKEENFKYEYKIELSKIIPKFLDDIKLLYFSKSFDIIEKILELFTILSDDNPDLIKKFVEGNGFQILLDLIISLFDENINNDVNQKLYKNIIDKILDILNTIISKETKYFKNSNDYSTLSIVIEKLIINFNPKNDFKQQRKLIKILSNLALFNDINDIIAKILLNKNIIKELFQNYYLYHKLDIIVFISNVIEKQSKNVRDFFIENGAFEIIKNNICNDICKDNRIIKLSIKILYQIIKEEKSYDIKLLFEKIYNTAIPDKIKNLVNDNNINNNLDNDIFINKSNEKISDIFNNLINDFEKYEKTLDFYFN